MAEVNLIVVSLEAIRIYRFALLDVQSYILLPVNAKFVTKEHNVLQF